MIPDLALSAPNPGLTPPVLGSLARMCAALNWLDPFHHFSTQINRIFVTRVCELVCRAGQLDAANQQTARRKSRGGLLLYVPERQWTETPARSPLRPSFYARQYRGLIPMFFQSPPWPQTRWHVPHISRPLFPSAGPA